MGKLSRKRVRYIVPEGISGRDASVGPVDLLKGVYRMREDQERLEAQTLSPYAAQSRSSRGRAAPISPCPLRTDFQRDRDRILHSKSFRRLKHKTQCFVATENDHYRTRLTHTLEVAQIARTIARACRLNEDLAEAIALGHDLGHTPFGHMGERTLNRLSPIGFRHNEHSLRIVTCLENDGAGLNLTFEVRDGILCHTGTTPPVTLEGQIIRLSDRIAYINHDIDDAIRAGVLRESDIPRDIADALGPTRGARIERMILDVVATSRDAPAVAMSAEIQDATDALRAFLFEAVYLSPRARDEERRADTLLTDLYAYYLEHPPGHESGIPLLEYDPARAQGPPGGPEAPAKDSCPFPEQAHRAACDALAGMTDQYAIRRWAEIFLPTAYLQP